jgi:RsiW-degrading membrane proteinase PrsW (M82 family)
VRLELPADGVTANAAPPEPAITAGAEEAVVPVLDVRTAPGGTAAPPMDFIDTTGLAVDPPVESVDSVESVPPARPVRIFTLPAVVAGVMACAMIVADVGVRGFAFGTLMAVVPVPFYVMLALWLDRYEAEPPRVLARTFVWGATVAICMAMLVNSYAEGVVGSAFGEHAASLFGAAVSAPVVEELAKGLALLILYRGMVDEFDGVVDGVVYAAMVGLGFAMVENVQYYGSALAEGEQSSILTFVVRGMMAPFAHPFFTSMIGIGLGVAREGPRDGRRHVPPMIGLGAAMALHSVWNLVTSDDRWFLGAYVLVMVPAFVGVLALVRFSLRREGNVVRQNLAPLVAAGEMAAEELERLARVRTRLTATWRAWRGAGAAGWRARRDFHQVASELAFHRWRVGRGITRGAASDAAREAEYLARMRELYAVCAALHEAPGAAPAAGARAV